MKTLDSIVVYCECGNIIFAVLEKYKTMADQQIIENYFNTGNRIGKASKEFVRENFGCKCKKLLYKI